MPKSVSRLISVFAVATIILLLPFSLTAQSIWVDRSHNKTIALEILKPNLAGDFYDNTTFPTSAMFFSLRLPISNRLNFVSEFPLAHAGVDYSSDFFEFDESETGIGNPYVGLEILNENSTFFTEIGVRAPLTPESNLGTTVGLFADFIDRSEAFWPDVLSVIAAQNYHHRAPSGFTMRLRGGPSFWIYTGDEDTDADVELFLLYSAQAGYELHNVSLMGGLSGRMIVTESDLNIGERTLHQFGASASVDLGRVRPGVQFRLPLDEDFGDFLDSVFGVSLAIEID